MLNAVVVLGVVAILALLITAAVVGQRLVGGERRVFRKWCGIWSVGVLLCLVTPGVLARLDMISEVSVGIFPAVYVVVFGPTLGWFINEMKAAQKGGKS